MKNFALILIIFILVTTPTFISKATSFQDTTRGQGVKITVANGEQVNLYDASYALVIGISQYQTGTGWSSLGGVKEDVVAIKQALEKQQFQVQTLENPTGDKLREGFEKFIKAYGFKPNNRLLIYYAGHGYNGKTVDGREQGYIVPSDAPNPDIKREEFNQVAMSMDEIVNYAGRIQSKHALFLLDSCFSGSLFKTRDRVPPAITEKTTRPVRQFITAGDANQPVPDRSEFRRQFIAALEGDADQNNDGYVTGSEIGIFLEDKVTNYSNRAQTPQWGKINNSALNQGDFVFALAKTITDTTVTTSPSKPKPKIEIEREAPLGTLVITANRKDMEIVLDGEVVAKSKAAGEKFTLKNVEAGRTIEVYGRVSGEKDILQKVELVASGKAEIALGTLLAANNSNPSNIKPNPPSSTGNTTATTAKPQEREKKNSIGMELVLIPAENFEMGSNDYDSEKPVHTVVIREAFYMGKCEVTQAQYKAIMKTAPSYFKGDNLPVEQVSWNEAVEFCKKLSEKEGREYRLPSEAEWEYGCRAGSRGDYAGNGNLDSMGWYDGNSGGKTHIVGGKQANAWGLYDMHGNVWEWCQDSWHDSYQGAPRDGSVWNTGADNSRRVLRGGSWLINSIICRSSFRFWDAPDDRDNHNGFRVVASARTLR